MVSVKCMKHISRMTRRETRYGMAWTKHKEKGRGWGKARTGS